ncbi:BrnT family toxin [Ramlibacter sp. 2FC]|uniref:BrnT family toxin n=1 Tax=Ramlibacter sp. 2FC TaxID=2502188 RepID=UPI0010F628D6|nr:BrnT family toxin [Ramlibacter sp. 2FC]
MNITFDAAKDAVNLAKHGVSLAAAAQLDWDNALVSQDDRRDYGELRQVPLAPMDDRLWVVVFTDRPEGRRVISLRKANLREYRRYEQAP